MSKSDYTAWLRQSEREARRKWPEHDPWIKRTRFGCAVYGAPGRTLLAEWEYEPDPYAEQKVRY